MYVGLRIVEGSIYGTLQKEPPNKVVQILSDPQSLIRSDAKLQQKPDKTPTNPPF